MIRILLIDDQKVIREKLKYMLEQAPDLEVVGTASDGHTALEQIELLQPDIALIDIEMPDLDGISATKIISRKFVNTKIIILSSFDNDEYVSKALDAGAKGYLLKNISERELQESIRFVFRGYSQILAPGLSEKLTAIESGVVNSSTNAPSSKSIWANSSKSVASTSLDLNLNNGAIAHNTPILAPLKSKKISGRFALICWAIVNTSIIGLSFLYSKIQLPTYVSEWALVVLGEKKIDLNIPQVGQASASDNAVIKDLDPRGNIVYLATSDSVLKAAANSLNLSSKEFGKPEIELDENASIIEFSIEGKSPAQAQAKAKALHQAIIDNIESFKAKQAEQEAKIAEEKIKFDKDKLKDAQNRLNQHQVNSQLISPDQIKVIIDKIESLRQQQNQIEVELQETNTIAQSLSSGLKLSPQQAQDALNLQADHIFQQYLGEYSQVSANLVNLQSRFTDSAPTVIEEQNKLQEIQTALLKRGNLILGKPLDQQILERLSLKNDNGRNIESMTSQLVSINSKQEALLAKKQTLAQQIQDLDIRLKQLAKEQVPFRNLQRDFEFAEAVLTSKTAKLNLNSDSSSAFPSVQLLAEPSLSDELDSSVKKVARLGIVAGLFISTIGLIWFWWEKETPWTEEKL
jgi:DNA-binding NarL/FixJ family response regulator/uncharacterized protein involved in exopolysaccharide biosynthesis